MNLKTKFPWFYKFPTWGKVIFWLCFWPFIIGVLMWLGIKNKVLRNTLVGIWALILFIIYIPIVFAAWIPSSNTNTKVENKTSDTKKVEVEKTPEELAKEQSDRETKKKAEELAKANRPADQKVSDLAGEIFKEKGFTSNLAETTAILSFDTSQGSFWDEKHYLESILKDFVKFGKEAVKIDKVDILEVNYRAKLVDSFGKDRDGNLILISMTKENFLKYNFENIKADNFYNSVSKNAYIYILPSTKDKIDFSKIKVYL